jgi:isopenicillin N synthase-like dioxygenase
VLASSSTERFSAPFFYNPSYESVVQPLTTNCLSNDSEQTCAAPLYSPIQWGMFRKRRFEGDFADVGEEVQIEHFRLKDTAVAAA